MTLSILFFLLIPLFLIPSILLPLNRLRMFLVASFSAFIIVSLLYLFNHWIKGDFIEQAIGEKFRWLSGFLYEKKTELLEVERNHLSFSFFLLSMYLLVYFIVFIPVKLIYVGNNPSFHKQLKTAQKIFVSTLFFLTTFGAAFFFLVNIRMILPFEDGFFHDFFDFLYHIEA